MLTADYPSVMSDLLSCCVRLALLAVVTAASLVAVPQADAQPRLEQPWRVQCGGPFQLCGYADPETGRLRIAETFEAAKPFREDLAAVRVDGRWGYVDRRGRLVIKPAFAEAGLFEGGYASVRFGEAYGVIDQRGRMVIRPQFAQIQHYHGDVFVAVPLDSQGASHNPANGNDPRMISGFGGAGLYHRQRGWVSDRNLIFTGFNPDRGLIWAKPPREDREEIWGVMRMDGTWQVAPSFSHVQGLNEGRAVVRSLPDLSLPRSEQSRTTLSGAVDELGRLVIPPTYSWLGYWRGGYGLASRRGPAPGFDNTITEPNAGLVAKDGSLLAGRWFEAVEAPDDTQTLPRGRLEGVWYSIQPDGKLVPDQKDGALQLACPDGLSFFHRGDQVEVRDPRGGTVGRFDDGHIAAHRCPYPFSLKREGRWFIVMTDGAVLGDPRGFDNLYGHGSDSIAAAVEVDGQWGLIDRQGRWVVTPRYGSLRPASENTFQIGEGEAATWIDASGRQIPKPQAPTPHPAKALTCPGGLSLFKSGEFWGMKDENGAVIIRPEHRALHCFRHGSAWAAAAGASEWCPIGPDGSRQRQYLCLQQVYPMRVTHHTPEQFDGDPFESSVQWNQAWLDHLAGSRPESPRWILGPGGRPSHSVMDGLPAPERIDALGPDSTNRGAMAYVVGAMPIALMAVGFWMRRRNLVRQSENSRHL